MFVRRWFWFWVLFCVAVILWLCGCGSFTWRSESASGLPAVPRPSPEQLEQERRALRFGEDVLAATYHEGMPKHAPVVAQGREAVRAGRARLGEPAAAIPVPPDPAQRSEEAERVTHALGGRQREYSGELAEWIAAYDALRSEPVTSTARFGWSFLRWIMGGALVLGLLIALVVMVPTAGTLLVWLWRRGRLALGTVRQIARGVDEFKLTDPEHAAGLKDCLSRNMDAESKIAVDRARRQ